MSEKIDLRRRLFLLLLAGAILPLASVNSSLADSGSGKSGSGDSDSDDDDDDSDDDNSGSGGDKSGHNWDDDNDHDDARDAVRKGKAISLSKALEVLKKSEPGRVLEVKLVKRSSGYDYKFKVIAANGKVKTVSMDASTGRIRGFLGL